MKAIKNNKEYTVDEDTKKAYLAQGYNICDDNGKVIEYAPTATVKRVEYDKLLKENEKLKAENKKLKVQKKDEA